MRKHLKYAILSVAAVAAAAIAAPTTSFAASCVPATNIGAIIDDSYSMVFNDPSKVRAEAMKLFINKQGNTGKTLGAVKFGTTASDLWAPTVIGPAKSSLASTLNTQLLSDSASTNYNLAFAQTKTNNPNADARIFLTDGGHNIGTYANGHAGGPRTYVIGLGIGPTGTDGLRLQQIATETGGQYFPDVTTSTVQAVVNQIDAILSCSNAPAQFNDTFTALNQSATHKVQVASSAKSLDIVVSWADPTNIFAASSFQILSKKTLYTGTASKRKRKKLRITKTVGSTYVTYHVSRFKKGTLRFKLGASALSVPGVVLTSQVTQNSTP